MAPLARLQEKYRERDVEFLIVYVQEAHPGERGYRTYVQPREFAQKLAHARELTGHEALTCPVLVDGMDDAVHRGYGGLPNMVYVIDKTGRVVYKATWTAADEIERVLAELTSAPAPAPGAVGRGRAHQP